MKEGHYDRTHAAKNLADFMSFIGAAWSDFMIDYEGVEAWRWSCSRVLIYLT